MHAILSYLLQPNFDKNNAGCEVNNIVWCLFTNEFIYHITIIIITKYFFIAYNVH